MILFIIIGLFIGLGLYLFNSKTDVIIIVISVGSTAIIFLGVSFLLATTNNVSLVNGYEEDVRYIRSYSGIELSPQERIEVMDKIYSINRKINLHSAMSDNLFIGFLYSKKYGEFQKIDYDLNESVLNIDIKGE